MASVGEPQSRGGDDMEVMEVVAEQICVARPQGG